MSPIGKHVIADLYGVRPDILQDANYLTRLFLESLKAHQFKVLKRQIHRFHGPFAGVTGIFLLAESHASFHTYPEYSYVAIDIFSCGAHPPSLMLTSVLKELSPSSAHITDLIRGRLCRRVFTSAIHPDLDKRSSDPKFINYHNRHFVGVENYESGDFNQETIFNYFQEDKVVWGTYEGGGVLFGTLVGLVDADGSLDLRWQYINAKNEKIAGTSFAKPTLLSDSRIRLQEYWRITEGGIGEGKSVIEEVINHS